MGTVIFEISASLDGFATAADQTPDEPMGAGGQQLHASASSDDERAKRLLDASLYVAPVLFGSGTPLFESLPRHVQLELLGVEQAAMTTHLRYRVLPA